MATVAIMGTLAAIAIPNYNKYQRRARQAEAKVNLSSAFMAESLVLQDQHSYTACLGQIGAINGGIQYYSIGFSNSNSAAGSNEECGPYGKLGDHSNNKAAAGANRSCLVYSWSGNPAVASGTCAVGDANTATPAGTFYTTTFPGPSGSPRSGVFAVGTVNGTTATDYTSFDHGTVPTRVAGNVFTLVASGNLGGTNMDMWAIDEQKLVFQIKDGVK